MKLHKVYHGIRDLSSAAAVMYILIMMLTLYASGAAWMYGCPLPRWYASGVWITYCVPVAAAIGRAVYAIAGKIAAHHTRRYGVITPEQICRIMEGRKDGHVFGAWKSDVRQAMQHSDV